MILEAVTELIVDICGFFADRYAHLKRTPEERRAVRLAKAERKRAEKLPRKIKCRSCAAVFTKTAKGTGQYEEIYGTAETREKADVKCPNCSSRGGVFI